MFLINAPQSGQYASSTSTGTFVWIADNYDVEICLIFEEGNLLSIKKNDEFKNEIRELSPDIACVVAYGKILSKEILEFPKYGCVNIHASLLPKKNQPS